MPGRQAMYGLIATRLRDEIRDGVWRLGDPLPGEIDLAQRYGVARATVVRALDVLRDEGLVLTSKGSGTRVAAVPVLSTVRVGRDDWAVARLPEDHERERLRMSPGVPVLVVIRAGSSEPELYDGALTRVAGA